MYVCMYVCMDGWMDGCTYVCMYMCIYIYIYVCIYIYIYICIYRSIYLSVYLSLSLSLYIYIYDTGRSLLSCCFGPLALKKKVTVALETWTRKKGVPCRVSSPTLLFSQGLTLWQFLTQT